MGEMIDEDELKRDCLRARWKQFLEAKSWKELDEYFTHLNCNVKIEWIMEFLEPEEDAFFEDVRDSL